ncbi:sel1 repeat family protein [Bradyrhizobium sp. WSM 1738]|uniref:tetratricopeptide repeat protein n=1 Tax=Bradyrhizobium hereditatis TaxID=2821405 RepID=UPI001CE39CE5|nr:tetratricopeptide repeat protein [Bradyrhizobium hereditatis]MCA6118801.1 sel1 repeat family protein [Bradyrhizobium hereditatis]
MKQAAVVLACLAVLIDFRTALASPTSDREMANRYEQSAQAGDDDAQFYLGALHSAGVGRPRSDGEAFRWFLSAANQGHPHAMLIVAGLYATGRGTTKDNVKAYSWAHIVASASKVEEYRDGARQLMSLLMKKMTSDEIGHAVVAARAWRAARISGAIKASNIERAADSESDQPAPAAPPPAPAVVQPAPAATSAPVVAQQAPSNVTVLPASPKVASAPPAKSAKRDDVRDLMDQVPSGLRKRFGF